MPPDATTGKSNGNSGSDSCVGIDGRGGDCAEKSAPDVNQTVLFVFDEVDSEEDIESGPPTEG